MSEKVMHSALLKGAMIKCHGGRSYKTSIMNMLDLRRQLPYPEFNACNCGYHREWYLFNFYLHKKIHLGKLMEGWFERKQNWRAKWDLGRGEVKCNFIDDWKIHFFQWASRLEQSWNFLLSQQERVIQSHCLRMILEFFWNFMLEFAAIKGLSDARLLEMILINN